MERGEANKVTWEFQEWPKISSENSVCQFHLQLNKKDTKVKTLKKKKPFAVTNGNVYLALHTRILNCLK